MDLLLKVKALFEALIILIKNTEDVSQLKTQ